MVNHKKRRVICIGLQQLPNALNDMLFLATDQTIRRLALFFTSRRVILTRFQTCNRPNSIFALWTPKSTFQNTKMLENQFSNYFWHHFPSFFFQNNYLEVKKSYSDTFNKNFPNTITIKAEAKKQLWYKYKSLNMIQICLKHNNT